jgi:PAS domain S-box-containing protein
MYEVRRSVFPMSSTDTLLDLSFMSGLLAASPDCITALSLDGTILYMNDKGIELRQLESAAAIQGRPFIGMWPVAERIAVAEAIQGAADGRLTELEGYCPTARGEPRWWESRFAPIKAEDDSIGYVVGVSRDISARRNADLTAHANEEKFLLLLESSGDGIYGMALDGSCTFINRAGARMLGYDADSLIGLSLHELIHHRRADGSHYPIEECTIYRAAHRGLSTRVDNEVFWHRDGRAIPVTFSVFPMIVDGSRTGTVVTFSDTTDRRRVENDLRGFAARLSEADRRKTEFLATLAHELRNPLAPLRNGLALLAKTGDRPEAIGRIREMMERQLAQMVHLINDLLDIARINSGKLDLKTELVDLKRIVSMALEASGPAIRGGGHTLRISMPPDAVFVRADATRLTQVFTNLLNNAAKYTPRSGDIALCADVLGEVIEIRISDNGIGIAPESLGAIFEMFTQVGRAANSVPGGLGIGLNLARRLVELHGGTVIAESAGIGLGSAFSVRIPLAIPDAQVALFAAPPRHDDKGVRILLVDDNVDAVESMGKLLSLGLHSTRIAHSGADALKIAAEFQPDIAFLDIGMPVMNGYELAHELRALPGLDRVKLVALTGWGGEDDRKRTSAAGFDGHLTKPADLDAVEELLIKTMMNQE